MASYRHWPTVKEAFKYAENNPDVWKVSFNVGGERIRLIRYEYPLWTDEIKPLWIYEPINIPAHA